MRPSVSPTLAQETLNEAFTIDVIYTCMSYDFASGPFYLINRCKLTLHFSIIVQVGHGFRFWRAILNIKLAK